MEHSHSTRKKRTDAPARNAALLQRSDFSAGEIDRFRKKFVVGEGCWAWTGNRRKRDGCPSTRIRGRMHTVGRVAYAWAYGSVPAGMFVCHHCDNPSCVRPDHLFLGTPADNCDDMVRKGRIYSRYGERNPNAKLTRDQVSEIRSAYAAAGGKYGTLINLARTFGLDVTAIRKIVRGISWPEAV